MGTIASLALAIAYGNQIFNRETGRCILNPINAKPFPFETEEQAENLLLDSRNMDFSQKLYNLFLAGFIFHSLYFCFALWTPVIKKKKLVGQDFIGDRFPSNRHLIAVCGLNSITNILFTLTKLSIVVQFIMVVKARYSHSGKVCSGDLIDNPLVSERIDPNFYNVEMGETVSKIVSIIYWIVVISLLLAFIASAFMFFNGIMGATAAVQGICTQASVFLSGANIPKEDR